MLTCHASPRTEDGMPNHASLTQRAFTFGLEKLCDGGGVTATPLEEGGGSRDSHSRFWSAFCCSL